jgi:hypothetical protein
MGRFDACHNHKKKKRDASVEDGQSAHPLERVSRSSCVHLYVRDLRSMLSPLLARISIPSNEDANKELRRRSHPELKETGITRALFEREPMTIRRYRCLNFCSKAVSQIGQASIDLSAAKSNEAEIWDTGGPISHTKRTTCCSIRQQFAGIQSNSCRTPQALQAPPSIQANR